MNIAGQIADRLTVRSLLARFVEIKKNASDQGFVEFVSQKDLNKINAGFRKYNSSFKLS